MPFLRFSMAFVLIGILIAGLSGCQSASSNMSSSRVSPILNHSDNGHSTPYGVFDLQSGHGKGKWKDSPDRFVR